MEATFCGQVTTEEQRRIQTSSLGGRVAVDGVGRAGLSGMTSSPIFQHVTHSSRPMAAATLTDSSQHSRPMVQSSVLAPTLGGTAHDVLEVVAVRNKKIYASGLTSSINLPQKRSQTQRGFSGGPYDAVVIGVDVAPDHRCP